jgi:signal recognition particle subunit SRP54
MFEIIVDRFIKLQRKILGYGQLSEYEINEALREIRITLLEADVNYKVVGEFLKNLQEKLNTERIKSTINPSEFIDVILFQEIVRLLGEAPAQIKFFAAPMIIQLVGLQGTGKTTTAAKLAKKFIEKKPRLVACDTKRPAAVEQLQILAKKINVDFSPPMENAVVTCQNALIAARHQNNQLIIIDTAGRLHIDKDLMGEMKSIKSTIHPHYVILVVDGMVGQDAVNQAVEFHSQLGLSGVIVTKLDGDAKGGAIISIRKVTNIPVYFVGVGEDLEDLEVFVPERMAMRIMGRGDIFALQEKIRKAIDSEKQKKITEKFFKGKFDFNDFLEQLQAIKKMGNVQKLLELIPFARGIKGIGEIDEKEFKHVEAIILSMTKEERRNPEIIDGSRRKRIAQGSGTTVEAVNRLLKEYQQAKLLAENIKNKKIRFFRP